MAPNDNVEFDLDVDGLAEAASDALRKHGGEYLPFFCWNCGKKILGGLGACPRCGALTIGKARYLSPHAPHRPGIASAAHPSVVRYRIKAIIGTLIFCVLFCIGLSIFMFVSGDLHFDDEGIHIMSMILTVLWLFWIIWLIVEYGGSGRKMRQARQYNRTPGNVRIVCGLCGHYTDRRANYCSKCGCILAK